MSRNYNAPWFGNVGDIAPSVSKKLKQYKNYRLFQNYFTWLLNIAKKEFDTQGLPETMDAKFIEDAFLWRGKVAARDLYGKPFSMEANPYNTLTIFRKPANGQCITGDGQSYESTFYWSYLDNKESSDAVLGYDNEEEYPFVNYIIDYAEQLADAMSSIRTAVKLSKLSGVIEIPEEQKNAVIKMLDDYDNNLPFIIVTTKKGGLPIDLNVMNFNNDSGKIKDLWDNYKNIEAEALSMFGISMNNNNDKKERMTQIEVVGNESIPKITEDARLKERKIFYDLVNEKFGTNITIKSNYNNEEEPKLAEKLESEDKPNEDDKDI